MADMEDHYFSCACHSDDHVFRFVFDPDDRELYLSVFLCQYRPWYKRLWYAARYVLGYRSRYGDWDSTTIREKDIPRLRDLCDRALAPSQKPSS